MRPKNLEKEAAIRSTALRMIAEGGLENLSMQQLAKAANISPRTIYIKYENKEDLLVKLFIDEVLGAYEKAILAGFSPDMNFAEGVKKLWLNAFRYLKNNPHYFALIQNGKSSPLLNKAYKEANIKEGDFFGPIVQFFRINVKKDIIVNFPFDVYKALLLSPMLELVNEYFDYKKRPKQIITEKVIIACCEAMIKGMMK